MHFPEVSPEQLYAPDVDDKYASLQAWVAKHILRDLDGNLQVPDPGFIPILEAIEIGLSHPDYTAYQELVREDFVRYPGRELTNIMNLQERKAQDHVIRHPLRDKPGRYPEGYDSPYDFMSFLHDLSTSEAAVDRYRQTSRLNVQTNVMDRGVLVKYAAQLLGYGDDPIHMIDAGCSRTLIAKKLAVPKRRQYPYTGTSVVLPRPDNPHAYVTDADTQEATRKFLHFINGDNLPVASVIGVDIQDPLLGKHSRQAHLLKSWVRNCLYPSETEPGLELDLMEEVSLSEVRFVQGDITNLGHRHGHERLQAAYADREKADIAYMWTVGYQIREEGTKAAFENLKPHMKPNGKILLFDYVDVDRDGNLDYVKKWDQFTCKGYVLDLEHEENGLQLLFVIDSGRVRRFMYSDYAARLALQRGLANLVPGEIPEGLESSA